MNKISSGVLQAVTSAGKRGISAPEAGRVVGVGTYVAKETLRALEKEGKILYKKGNYFILSALD